MELAAAKARREAIEKTGLENKDIGVYFITPCPAKMTSIRTYMFLDEPVINGAFSVNDIYAELLPVIKKIDKPENLAKASIHGAEAAEKAPAFRLRRLSMPTEPQTQ